MLASECFRLGTVTNTHGVKGGLHCLLDTEDSARYASLGHVFLGEGDKPLTRYTVQEISIRGNTAYLHLQGIDTLEKAGAFRGCGLFLPLSALPDPGEGRFYIHEAFGFRVVDRQEGDIGIFAGVVESPGQMLAQVREGTREILVPLVAPFIERIDRGARILYVTLPEGMADLYR